MPEHARPLVLAWLIAALLPRGPYPHLMLWGDHGSAKSTTARLIAALIDPCTPALWSELQNVHDLMIAACGAWRLAFDNISTVPAWLFDALCRLSTGGDFATRELYSDTKKCCSTPSARCSRPGSLKYVSRPDLLDRTIVVELPPIADNARWVETEFWVGFERAWPALFGALLTRLARTLRELPAVRLPRLPRMADFALVAVAAERGAGEPARLLYAYDAQRAEAHQAAVEASAIGPALLTILAREGEFTGTASELLETLQHEVGERASRRPGFPASPRGLSGELRRLAPALRAVGWDIAWQRTGKSGARTVTIIPAQPLHPSPGPHNTPTTPSAPSAVGSPAAVWLTVGSVRLTVVGSADGADGCAGTSGLASSAADVCVVPGCAHRIDAFAPDGRGYCAAHLPPDPEPDPRHDPAPGPGSRSGPSLGPGAGPNLGDDSGGGPGGSPAETAETAATCEPRRGSPL